MEFHKVKTEREVRELLGHILTERAQEAIATNDAFRLGVSGGLRFLTAIDLCIVFQGFNNISIVNKRFGCLFRWFCYSISGTHSFANKWEHVGKIQVFLL